ncbi:MAG: hypothetical protein QOJ42_4932 [Acidobacteriaceae bacterium]|nr:hypothetical protein [Acidobacteriaceae bacterium]
MKRSLSKAIFLIALACTPSLVHAQSPSQTPSVDFGRTTVQLGSSFLNSIQGLGAVITDLRNNPLQDNSFTVRATGGAVDLTTSAGEIEHTGGLRVNAAGTILRIQNLTLDTSNPTNIVITADYIVNDHFASRVALFSVQPPPTLTLPLQLQSGVLQVNGMVLTLAPAAASTLNSIFGGPVVQAGSNIGTANIYVVFSPSN